MAKRVMGTAEGHRLGLWEGHWGQHTYSPRYELSTVPRRRVTRLKASVNFVFDEATTAFDSFTVPSRTMPPSNFAACTVAARRSPDFST